MLISILVLLCLPIYCTAETALGGLHTNDSLATVMKALGNPELIQARRRNGPGTDQAILIYQRQGAIYAGMTPYGDRLEHLLTESPTLTTNDGIKIGDQRSNMVSKRGEPEEITTDQPGVAECWYWSQGLNFAVSEETGRILNIFIFPPIDPDERLQEINVPGGTFEISHEYTDKQPAIVGRISNTSDDAQYNVRVGITLYDKDHKVIDVVVADIGCLMPGAGFPFKAAVERKGRWTDYSVDYLVRSTSDSPDRQIVRASKSSLAAKKTIVLPVSDPAKPK